MHHKLIVLLNSFLQGILRGLSKHTRKQRDTPIHICCLTHTKIRRSVCECALTSYQMNYRCASTSPNDSNSHCWSVLQSRCWKNCLKNWLVLSFPDISSALRTIQKQDPKTESVQDVHYLHTTLVEEESMHQQIWFTK